MSKKLFFLLIGTVLSVSSGCAVPQPRGAGQYMRVQEPRTKAWFHLYLPSDYVKNNGRHPDPKMRKWPLVMTFHGMKPYDNALPQEREWEKLADIYGYIVCAPELWTCDSFMEYPLTQEHDYVLHDKQAVIAIMNHVFNTTHADPRKVLSTSWSCGGYLAHYFPNRFPGSFTCIATRLSNFSAKLMVEETVPLYRDRVPVAIFIGDGDFPACKYESEEAVAWYQARGFKMVRGKMIDNMGHHRIPQTCAAFFAEQIKLEPLKPLEAAATLAEVQMTEYQPSPELFARLSPRGTLPDKPGGTGGQRTGAIAQVTPPMVPPTARESSVSPTPERKVPLYVNANAGKRYPADRPPTYDPTPVTEEAKKQASTPTRAVPDQTKVVSADRPRTWLDPTKAPPNQGSAGVPPAASRPQRSTRSQESGVRSQESNLSAAPLRSSPKPTMPPPAPTQVATAQPRSQFNPQNAGARDYHLMEARPRDGGSRLPARHNNPVQKNAKQASAAPSVAHSQPPRSKAQRVNVKVNGPAIGSAPHYLRYSVDLPREKLDGADILWMDNGVWMGDDPGGSRIIDSPGLHFITVLVVTKDATEYRGQAKVSVLERVSTAANLSASP